MPNGSAGICVDEQIIFNMRLFEMEIIPHKILGYDLESTTPIRE